MPELFGDVATFVAVVESGGFAAAARRLNLSRSAVGRTVAGLELRLGAQLLRRTTRRVALTEDGQGFLEHCRRALDELDAGRSLLERGRREIGGVLRVSVPVLYGRIRVAPVLARLALRNPLLALELDFRDGLVDLLGDRFDLVVRMGAIGAASGLSAVRIGEERTVLCASPAYLGRHGVPAGPEALGDHVAITYNRDGRGQPWMFRRADGTALAVRPPSRFRFDDLGAIMDAAVAGIGLAWLPDWLAAVALRDGALVAVLPGVPATIGPIHAVWATAEPMPRRVRAAIDALKRGGRFPSAVAGNGSSAVAGGVGGPLLAHRSTSSENS